MQFIFGRLLLLLLSLAVVHFFLNVFLLAFTFQQHFIDSFVCQCVCLCVLDRYSAANFLFM